MASSSRGSVRIGPLSLLSLIIILSLAVMAVLALSTAKAELSITRHQSETVRETYRAQNAGEAFLTYLDKTLASYRGEDGQLLYNYETMLAAVDNTLDDNIELASQLYEGIVGEASLANNQVSASFEAENGRRLDAVIIINADATYTVYSWKVSTAWDTSSNDVLWSGADDGSGVWSGDEGTAVWSGEDTGVSDNNNGAESTDADVGVWSGEGEF